MVLEFGLTLLHEDRTTREKAFVKFTELTELCGRFGCALNIGLFRGRALGGQPISFSKALFVEILREGCDYAEQFGVPVNFEPTNRFETNFIQTTTEGLEIIERVNRPNLGLLLDLYHMYIEDDDLYASIELAGDRIRHVHFSDSDRWPPGVSRGELDFPRIVSLLQRAGYEGYLSVGLLKTDDPEENARTTVQFLRSLIDIGN
jgi:sugar phosphate isomerase/epimerase